MLGCAVNSPVSYLGSLERLERLTMTAVTLGFALLTIGIITGAIEMRYLGLSTSAWKVGLTALRLDRVCNRFARAD